MNLYITADTIGGWTGGSKVTFHESEALKSLGECEVYGRNRLEGGADPWGWDQVALRKITTEPAKKYKIAHFYSGSMTNTVKELRSKGTKVCYTVAAHRVSDSKKAHEELGLSYAYPHLTELDQWRKYSGGYWESNVLVLPSKHSAEVVTEQMNELGIDENSRPTLCVIPHGCDYPNEAPPLPKKFVVGYSGVWGADKGVTYLLEAWKKLNYKDALLIFAGGDSTTAWAKQLLSRYGGGSIYLMGWVPKLEDFFRKISLYIQPSTTEGFGIPVIEAMAHGRPVLCSDHAGACDVTPYRDMVFKASDVNASADAIENVRKNWNLEDIGKGCREEAEQYSSPSIRERYVNLWKGLVSP